MSNIYEGLNKSVIYKRETTFGVLPGTGTATSIRRVSANFNLSKEIFTSSEIRNDRQSVLSRHGIRSVEGSVNGELSPGSYSDFFAAAVARDFTAGVSSTGLTADIDGTLFTITRATGSFLTAGFKIGDVVRATGFVNAVNNDNNFFLTGVTATVLTFNVLSSISNVLVSETAVAAVTVAVVGKKTFVPTTGHTDVSYTFEELYTGTAGNQSEVFVGNKINTLSVDLPASGLTTLDVAFMGQDLAQKGTAAYFVSPAAQSTATAFTAVNGALILNGSVVGLVTGANFSINRNLTMEPVVGSNIVPAIFESRVLVDGEFTAFFLDGTFRDLFIDETETSLYIALTTSEAKNSDVMAFALPRVKINSATKDDGEKGIVQTFAFEALRNVLGGTGTATEDTTIVIQDSLSP